jgi:hypothetical protein
LGNSPRLGLKIYEDPERGCFPNMMNFLNFRNLTKRKVSAKQNISDENRYLPFHKIPEI